MTHDSIMVMDKVVTDEQKIQDILTRGVEEVFVQKDLLAILSSGKQLRIKLGIDPTGPKIHLGRAIPLRKLRDFQRLGHQVVLVVGDFTAQVGDASDKQEKRPILTRKEIDENIKDYKNQIGKIIDISKTEFVYNNDWLAKLSFGEVVTMAECFSVQQMLARRNFKERYDRGSEISLREFLYPIMQGYDSVHIKADVEIGGFDQLFNVKAGRVMQDFFNQPKQQVMVGEMLEGTDGRKMSTSWGNVITVVDEPFLMFGKIMSLRDDLIIKYFRLCTDVSLEEIEGIKKELESGTNPKDVKLRLATEITTLYHTEKDAALSKNSWIETFSKGGIPDDVEEVKAEEGKELVEVLLEKGFISSKGDWRRLIESGSITTKEGETITDIKEKIKNVTLRIGKKRFVKIVIG